MSDGGSAPGLGRLRDGFCLLSSRKGASRGARSVGCVSAPLACSRPFLQWLTWLGVGRKRDFRPAVVRMHAQALQRAALGTEPSAAGRVKGSSVPGVTWRAESRPQRARAGGTALSDERRFQLTRNPCGFLPASTGECVGQEGPRQECSQLCPERRRPLHVSDRAKRLNS